MVPLVFLEYTCFCCTRFLPYGMLYHMENTWVFSSITWENAANPLIGENLEKQYPCFSQRMGGSLPLDSHLMVGFITSKMHRSSRRCPIALENATKPILWEGSRTLVTILFPKIHHRLCFITSEMHRSSRQCPIALKKATKPILWEEPRKLVPILFPKYTHTFPKVWLFLFLQIPILWCTSSHRKCMWLTINTP